MFSGLIWAALVIVVLKLFRFHIGWVQFRERRTEKEFRESFKTIFCSLLSWLLVLLQGEFPQFGTFAFVEMQNAYTLKLKLQIPRIEIGWRLSISPSAELLDPELENKARYFDASENPASLSVRLRCMWVGGWAVVGGGKIMQDNDAG